MGLFANAIVRDAGHGLLVAVLGDLYRFLATGEETENAYAQFEAIVLPGGGPPRHRHSREVETFYVLEGNVTFQVEDQRLVGSAGTFIHVPKGIVHAFKNESQQTARMLISVVPAGLERLFFEVGQVMPAGTISASPPTQEEVAQLLAAAPRYGVEILPGPSSKGE